MCYGVYFGCKTFEDLLDNRHFILKNLTYLNVTLTGNVQRWKLYLQDKDFYLCMFSPAISMDLSLSKSPQHV